MEHINPSQIAHQRSTPVCRGAECVGASSGYSLPHDANAFLFICESQFQPTPRREIEIQHRESSRFNTGRSTTHTHRANTLLSLSLSSLSLSRLAMALRQYASRLFPVGAAAAAAAYAYSKDSLVSFFFVAASARALCGRLLRFRRVLAIPITLSHITHQIKKTSTQTRPPLRRSRTPRARPPSTPTSGAP